MSGLTRPLLARVTVPWLVRMPPMVSPS